MDTKQTQEVYSKLAAPFPEDAVQRTKKEETKKGYDTTGIGYQRIVDRFNEVLGVDGWGFSYEVIKENNGTFRNGTPFTELTVGMKIWVGSKENERSCAGGHISSTYSDALKGAITNSFKKTAAFWGVGREAYAGELDDDTKYEDEVKDYTHPQTPKMPLGQEKVQETVPSATLPKCDHGEPAKRVMSKSAKNPNRWFYTCGFPQGKQCGYFQWEDELVGTDVREEDFDAAERDIDEQFRNEVAEVQELHRREEG